MSLAEWLSLDLNRESPAQQAGRSRRAPSGPLIDTQCGSPQRGDLGAVKPIPTGQPCHRCDCRSERRFGVRCTTLGRPCGASLWVTALELAAPSLRTNLY